VEVKHHVTVIGRLSGLKRFAFTQGPMKIRRFYQGRRPIRMQ